MAGEHLGSEPDHDTTAHRFDEDRAARLAAALLTEDIPYLTGETIYLDGAHGVNH